MSARKNYMFHFLFQRCLSTLVFCLGTNRPQFPGPLGARFSKAYAVYSGVLNTGSRYFEWQEQVHQKYGSDVIRTGPREVTIYSADAIPLIHGPMSKCVKPDSFYGISRDVAGDSLQTTPDKKEHRQRRKIWDHAFNAKALRDYEPRLNRHAISLMSRLKEQSSKGPIRITNWINFYSFDVMGDVGFNRSFGMLDKGKEDDVIKLLHDSVESLSIGTHIPWSMVLALRTNTGAKPLAEHIQWSRKVLEDRIKVRRQIFFPVVSRCLTVTRLSQKRKTFSRRC